MKFFAFVLVAQAVLLQTAYSYVISAPSLCAPLVGQSIVSPSVLAPSVIRAPGPVFASSVVQPNTVANSLADTLSLLTVSSLLAETLPLPTPVMTVSTLPIGCGCGYGNFGSTILI